MLALELFNLLQSLPPKVTLALQRLVQTLHISTVTCYEDAKYF